MSTEPRMVADTECMLGEGPIWHPDEQCLYWTDIRAGRLYRYHPATETHEVCFEGDAIGGFTLQEDGSLLFFMDRCEVKEWRHGELKPVLDGIPAEPEGFRFNDIIAEAGGRVYCGTFNETGPLGRLYRMDHDGTLTQLLDGIGCSNGLGFTPDRTQMYYTDSLAHEIYVFDYDETTAALTNQRVLINVPEVDGVADGLTVDAEGYIWSARYGGSCLVRHDTTGAEVQRIEFPSDAVTCVTFGGENYQDMYVTTAGGQDRAENGPGAGALFRVDAGVGGFPEFRSRIRVP